MIFTEALNEYLEAKKDLDDKRKNFTGYRFGDAYWKESNRLSDAEEVLNSLFDQIKGETNEN